MIQENITQLNVALKYFFFFIFVTKENYAVTYKSKKKKEVNCKEAKRKVKKEPTHYCLILLEFYDYYL